MELAEKFWKEVVEMIRIANIVRIKENINSLIVIKTRPMTNL